MTNYQGQILDPNFVIDSVVLVCQIIEYLDETSAQHHSDVGLAESEHFAKEGSKEHCVLDGVLRKSLLKPRRYVRQICCSQKVLIFIFSVVQGVPKSSQAAGKFYMINAIILLRFCSKSSSSLS